ncbi:MAG TPA: DUF2934 domain-containing protein [Terriglobales bacterium]|nr:DUF2934 domain-containing protein [Terriglobales bacterium]
MTKRNTAVEMVPEELTPDASQPNADIELQEQIRQRAYELFEQRGKEDGFAEQDWLQAEAELTHAKALKAAA